MRKKHIHVTLIDLPEVLPFGFVLKGVDFDLDQKKQVEAEEKLSAFIADLETQFGEEFIFIGEDIIEEKLFKRYLFSENGFFEVMIGFPVVISAHFVDKTRAEKFAECLRSSVKKAVSSEKALSILLNSITIGEGLEDDMGYDKWEKMKKIHDDVGE
jgi:hypothetical protein